MSKWIKKSEGTGKCVHGWSAFCDDCDAKISTLRAQLEEERAEISAQREIIEKQNAWATDAEAEIERLQKKVGDREADIQEILDVKEAAIGKLCEENERLKNFDCGKCHRSLAPDGDCHGCRADRLEMEIERLEKRVRGDDRAMLQYEDALEEYCAAMRAVQSRARAWKRCAKRWRGIIRMWPKGLVSAPELEIKLETLSELNPRPESKSEPE